MSKRNVRKWIILLILMYCSYPHTLPYGNSLNRAIQVKITQNNEIRANNYHPPARDPFFSPTPTHCMTEAERFRQWVLGGIISNQGNRHGWVVKPGGIWQKVMEGEHLPGNWQVTRIHSRQIDLLQTNRSGSCTVFIQAVF